MTVLEWQADSIIAAAKRLAHFVKTTEPDWLGKRPAVDDRSKTRSVLDQVGECIRTNRRMAAILSGTAPSGAQPQDGEVTDPEAGCEMLMESARELSAVVRAQDESMMARTYELPFGQFPGSFCITVPAWNMIYH